MIKFKHGLPICRRHERPIGALDNKSGLLPIADELLVANVERGHIQTQVPGNIGGRTEADFDFCPQAAVAEMFVDCGAVHRGAVVSPRRLEAARRCSCYNGSCYAAALSAAARFRAQYARMRCA